MNDSGKKQKISHHSEVVGGSLSQPTIWVSTLCPHGVGVAGPGGLIRWAFSIVMK